MTTPASPTPKPKVVYAIIDRPPRKHWLRIGLAFVNRDGSLNVRIDAVPLTGSLHIRDEPLRTNGADAEPAMSDEPPSAPATPKPRRSSTPA